MMDVEALRARWLALFPAAPERQSAARAVFDELRTAYATGERRYHTLDHVAALLALVDREATHFRDRTTVELAVFFHDAIYDAKKPAGNEQVSADYAWNVLQKLEVDEHRFERVAFYIEETLHDGQPVPDDADLRRFLDLDLAILAAPAAEYDAYAAAIRSEYAHVPDGDYRAGRARVLRSFLDRSRLYHCDDHHAAWDAAARANIARELARLEARPS